MNNVKQINTSKQLELHSKYGKFIKELFTSLTRLRDGSFTKIIRLNYEIKHLKDSVIELSLLECNEDMKTIYFHVWFGSLEIEDIFRGSINIADSETSNDIIIMLCLNIAEFINDVTGKNK
ncbi:MAG: hypothetical protein ACRC51_00780 [Cetobacterium sp.]